MAQRQTAGVALPAEEQAALDNLRGELFVLRARIGLPDGDGQKIRKLCQHALSQLSPANRLARSEALLLQCSADAFLGDLEPATRSALEGAELAQEGGSLPQTLVYLAYAILVLHQRGQFHEALRIAQRAEQVGRMPDGLHLPMMSVVLLYQSWILLEWNRLEEALDLARRALELKEHTGLILKQSRLYIGEPARGSPSVGTPPRLYSTLSRPGTGLKRLT